MSEIIRVFRILEYTGTRQAVERNLVARGIKGTFTAPNLTIREALIEGLPEILEQSDTEKT